jgi:hypothetical protein
MSTNQFSTLYSDSDSESSSDFEKLEMMPMKTSAKARSKRMEKKRKTKLVDITKSLFSSMENRLPTEPSRDEPRYTPTEMTWVGGEMGSEGVKRVVKEVTKKDMSKTQVCKSVWTKSKCPHGERCRFAHTEEELRMIPCKWDTKCKHGQKCRFAHSGESKKDFIERTKPPVNTGLKMVFHQKKPIVGKVIKATPEPEMSKEKDLQVIEVPKDLAIGVIKSMIESGRTNFHVKIF